MTLDCSYPLILSLQPRVICVHSYYLTSLVNLSFCRFDIPFFLSSEFYSAARSLHYISLQREALMCRIDSFRKGIVIGSFCFLLFAFVLAQNILRLLLFRLLLFALGGCSKLPVSAFANSFCFSLVPYAIAFGHQRFAFCNLFSAFNIHFSFYAIA